ncbi:hypothetical protein PPACK8108_LOCUS17192 [Phakopsora pachyrhizi]|uniref:Uncharacterized protein n=1 Tax=Phakopsora pachyrhizi TaxID=170000 RepID=A0AAV0B9A2_PHAPC|nr:hypothetical protein PPACK8108_LOCUS17192 [Phakopsora pachyrhizi]
MALLKKSREGAFGEEHYETADGARSIETVEESTWDVVKEYPNPTKPIGKLWTNIEGNLKLSGGDNEEEERIDEKIKLVKVLIRREPKQRLRIDQAMTSNMTRWRVGLWPAMLAELCAEQVIGVWAQAQYWSAHVGHGSVRTPHMRMRVMEEVQYLLCSSRKQS